MRALWFLPALALITACGRVAPVDPVPIPPARPERPAALNAPLPPRPAAAAAQDGALVAYYARVEERLLTRGLLRRDGGGPDTPYDARRLADTFLRLAFFEEYAAGSGVLVARETESRLHRWAQPVRIETRFGASVPASKRAKDTSAIAQLSARLARATRHPVSTTARDGNFVVYIVDEAERRALGPALRSLAPALSNTELSSVLDLPRSSYCIVFAIDPGDNGRYARAVALIRAEHPDLLRLSCIHEEIAQGLGLANDSPRARPSIFNDDEEFALLTDMDEQLLRLLYDPRLTPGMSLATATPIVRRLAAEIMGGPS